MKNIHETSNAALLSSLGTSAYETGIQFSNGNPYEYFHSLGINLDGFILRILPKPRTNGVAITCRANIDGIIYTIGAATYDALIEEITEKYRRHRASVTITRERKKTRCMQRFIDKYPDATVFPAYFVPNMKKGGAE